MSQIGFSPEPPAGEAPLAEEARRPKGVREIQREKIIEYLHAGRVEDGRRATGVVIAEELGISSATVSREKKRWLEKVREEHREMAASIYLLAVADLRRAVGTAWLEYEALKDVAPAKAARYLTLYARAASKLADLGLQAHLDAELGAAPDELPTEKIESPEQAKEVLRQTLGAKVIDIRQRPGRRRAGG